MGPQLGVWIQFDYEFYVKNMLNKTKRKKEKNEEIFVEMNPLV